MLLRSSNSFGGEGLEKLSGVLAGGKRLTVWTCRTTTFSNGDSGVGKVSEELWDPRKRRDVQAFRSAGNGKALTVLQVSRNDNKNKGAASLAGLLGKCHALTELGMSHNKPSEASADLSAATQKCPGLSRFDVSSQGDWRQEFAMDGWR